MGHTPTPPSALYCTNAQLNGHVGHRVITFYVTSCSDRAVASICPNAVLTGTCATALAKVRMVDGIIGRRKRQVFIHSLAVMAALGAP